MRSNGVIVEDFGRDVGGKQSFTLTVIPLKFNGDVLTIACCEPTNEELLALKVNWITPPVIEKTPQSIRRAKRAMEEYQLRVPDEQEEILEEEFIVHGCTLTDPEAGKGKRKSDNGSSSWLFHPMRWWKRP